MIEFTYLQISRKYKTMICKFKQFLDAAAKATEDENPALSIMFDGIGFVLASDYLEAVNKIFSMFKTLGKINDTSTVKCFGY